MTPMYEHSKSFYCDKRSRNLDGFVKLKRRFEMQGKDLSPDVSDDGLLLTNSWLGMMKKAI